jgi:hypothetical protein
MLSAAEQLPIIMYGCETWPFILHEETRTGCRGKYLDSRKMKWQEAAEKQIMRSFIIFALRKILLG